MSEEDISLVLNAVEEKLADPTVEPAPPIVMMLHGPEARHFLRSNYTKNQSLVDLGAKLAGYGLIDVKTNTTNLNCSHSSPPCPSAQANFHAYAKKKTTQSLC
jgi:hypothetical protein